MPQAKKRDEFESPAEYRWWLLKLAKRALPENDRLQRCMVAPLPGTPVINIVVDPNFDTAHVEGNEHCHNKWACPTCSAWMTNEARRDMDEVIARALIKRWHPVLVTLTVQHHRPDELARLVDGISRALRRMNQQRSWRNLKDEFGVQGQVRAHEVLWGKQNGWHPHFHILLFLDIELTPAQVEALRAWIFDLWLAALQKEGLSASAEHGVDVATANSKIAEYVAKWGHEPKEQAWGVGHEMTKAPAKLSDGELLTPFQLLEASATDKQATALFREYVAAMRGSHQLHGLKDLQSKLADVELPDRDPDYTPVPKYTAVSMQPDENWKKCCKYDLVPKLTGLAAIRATDALRDLLAAWEIVAVVFDAPMATIVDKRSPGAAQPPSAPAGNVPMRSLRSDVDPAAMPAAAAGADDRSPARLAAEQRPDSLLMSDVALSGFDMTVFRQLGYSR